MQRKRERQSERGWARLTEMTARQKDGEVCKIGIFIKRKCKTVARYEEEGFGGRARGGE